MKATSKVNKSPMWLKSCAVSSKKLKLDKSNFVIAGFFISFIETINCMLYAFVFTLGFKSECEITFTCHKGVKNMILDLNLRKLFYCLLVIIHPLHIN